MFIILGAYQWMSSGGDKTNLQAARDKVINALIALIILLSVFAILNLVGQVFGINLTSFSIPTIGGDGGWTGGGGGPSGGYSCVNVGGNQECVSDPDSSMGWQECVNTCF